MISSDGKKSIITLTVLTVISTVFLALRLWRKRKSLGADDWLLCFALLLIYIQDAGGYCCGYSMYIGMRRSNMSIVAIKGGEGIPMEALTSQQLEWLLKVKSITTMTCILISNPA